MSLCFEHAGASAASETARPGATAQQAEVDSRRAGLPAYEKLAIVTDAMRGVGMPDGEYAFGSRHGMKAIVRNREARIPDGTALASSVFPMNEMVRIFRDLTGCPLWQAVRMASLTPAEIIGVADELGSLAPGKSADVVLFDERGGDGNYDANNPKDNSVCWIRERKKV